MFQIYHRQIFKILLSNKVLEDPRQRRLFKTNDLVELFNFNESINGHSSESDQLFQESKLIPLTNKFSSNKIEKMQKMAAKLSKNISQNVSKYIPAIQITVTSDNNCSSSCYNNNVDQDIKIYKNNLTKQIIKNENIVFSENEKNDNNKIMENKIVKNIEHNTDNMIDKLENENYVLTNKSNSNIKKNEIIIQSDSNITKVSYKNNQMILCNKNKDASLKLNKMHYKKKNKKSSISENHTTSALFEGERISHLIGRRLRCSLTEESKSIEDDQYVLEKLFAKANVTSAFQHETVLSNSKYNSDDKNPMQRLARETAQENMDNIRKSRKWCWKPTWNSTLLKNN